MSELKSESRKTWTSNGFTATVDELKVGCLQRIADASELSAKNHAELVRSLDYYKNLAEERYKWACKLERKNRSLRGVITRINKKTTKPA